jgi:hypothetical protein
VNHGKSTSTLVKFRATAQGRPYVFKFGGLILKIVKFLILILIAITSLYFISKSIHFIPFIPLNSTKFSENKEKIFSENTAKAFYKNRARAVLVGIIGCNNSIYIKK